MRARDRGRPHRGRLQHVVAADRLQAATDEGHVRAGVERHQFTQRVEHEHVVARGRPAIGAPRADRPARLARGSRRTREPFRVPRRPQQQQVGPAAAQARVQGQHRRFFVLMRAGGDPHAPATAQMLAEPVHHLAHVVRHRDVELEVADIAHLRRQRAELHEAGGVVAGLRRDLAHGAQGARDQRAQHAVAPQRARRQPRIEDVDRHLAVVAAEQQAGPQLGLHDQRQARRVVAEEARHRAGQVVGRIHVQHALAPQRLDALRSGRRDGGDEHAQAAMPLQQRVDHRCGRVDFAHRHRMQPDIDRAAGRAVAAVAFVPALEVFRIAETAPDQVVDGDRRQYVKHRRIQGAQQAFGGAVGHGPQG